MKDQRYMPNKTASKFLYIFMFLFFTGQAFANPEELSSETKANTIKVLIDKVEKEYVFPKKAKVITDMLRNKLESNEYANSVNSKKFADRLTQDLQQVANDKHLQVIYEPEEKDLSPEAQAAQTQGELEMWKAHNYGIEKIERLSFNIGYLKLAGFAPTAQVGPFYAATMNLLDNTDSLIIDLRDNFGGYENSVTLLASYFFNQRTHLIDMYKRKGDKTEQHWSHDYVEGSRYGEQKPVYILINKNSFSAAEDFSYTLKNLGRATLVGETTGGGANSGEFVSLTPHYSVFLPTGSGISPITNTNWEGTGVEPDISVDSKNSLAIAQIAILEKMKNDESNSARIKRIESRIESLK